MKMVKNCVRNRSRPDKIETETELCTSLKSEFYFRFRWPPSTMSKLISYISGRVFATIRGKICPPQSRNWKMGILHISKSVCLLPICLINNMHLADHISKPYAKFYPCKRRHSRWKLSQELKLKISFLPDYTHAKMAGRKRERYKIEPRISVPFMLESKYESKIFKKY